MRILYVVVMIGIFTNVTCQNQLLNAGEIVTRIKNNITSEWSAETVDNFKSGDDQSSVTGIATTFLATLDVLQRAKAQGLNMIITHEPTFYNHFDEIEQFGEDPVLKAKLNFIEDNEMVVWRFHDHWHRTDPDGIYKGIIDQLDWGKYIKEDFNFVVPETTLKELATFLKASFDARAIRVVGDPDMKVSNVAMRLGAPQSLSHIERLKQEDVDVLIGGETREWETVEYVRDANTAGMKKGLILLGHAISEEGGMDYCADWLKTFISEIPVRFIPANEPFWLPD